MSPPIQTQTTFDAATYDTRLFREWTSRWLGMLDPNADYAREGEVIAQRVWRQVFNDPNVMAMLTMLVTEIVGTGLWFRSAWQSDDQPSANDIELAIRRGINAVVMDHFDATRLDAGNMLSAIELQTQILISGWVHGDGIAVRCWNADRPGSSGYGMCWRVVDAGRVSNPTGTANGPRFCNGFEVNDGQLVAIHVKRAKLPGDAAADVWDRIPFFASDGSRIVIHYVPQRYRPGAIRGTSAFAVLLVMAKHLQLLLRAHVAGKGIQAMHPMAIKVDNPAKAAEAAAAASADGKSTPMQDAAVMYLGKNSDVVFPPFSYNGADLRDFVDTCLRSFCAALGYPFQFVLRQLSDANLAAAQAALDQADKTTTGYQDSFIHQVSRHLVESVLREAVARRRIPGITAWTDRLLVGIWRRPRRADANRSRTREAALSALKSGVSLSTVQAEMGYDFLDETEQLREDFDTLKRAGVPVPAGLRDALTAAVSAVANQSAPVADPEPDDDETGDAAAADDDGDEPNADAKDTAA